MPMPPPLELQQHPLSALSFPWAFDGNMNLRLGGSGAEWSEVMYINFEDLQVAVQELLGYSWRDESTIPLLGFPQLRRKLPWQHPYFNQLFVKSITDVSGIRMTGTNTSAEVDDDFIQAGGGVGLGVPINLGPWTTFQRLRLTVQFWRPPYFIRSDEAVRDASGYQQEWLRYVDKHWSAASQILSREGSQFLWSGGSVTGLPGTVGQVVTHQRVTRTWYEIPEQCLFEAAQDGTPQGQATNMLYSLLQVINPITGYVYETGYPMMSAVNMPIGGGVVFAALAGTLTEGSPTIAVANTTGISVGDMVSGDGIPTGATVQSLVASTSITVDVDATETGATTMAIISDADASARLFGCAMGILRYDNVEVLERPLQLPPYLMQVPLLEDNEAISQVQYDVKFHFDIFDPPRGSSTGAARGHNLMPWSGNGLWYPVNSQLNAAGVEAPPFLTVHSYADLSTLFQIL
jgi:hypothetical protein